MASSYTTNKSLEKPANGDYVDTWEVPVNSDMDVLDQAFGSTTSLNATGGSATLTASQYRSMRLYITGSIATGVTYTIPSGVGGQWIIDNATSGVGTITIASAGAGTSVQCGQGKRTQVFSDGTNINLADDNRTPPAGSNTQIQYNASGSFGASANLTWDGTNVGIGTSSPDINLRVSGSYSQIGTIDGTVDNRFVSTSGGAAGIVGTYSNHPLVFYTNTADRMRITSAGNVGIGTATPGYPLSVAGVIQSTTGGIRYPDGTTQTTAATGTVTSITAGTGLTGGTITGSGTIALSSPVAVANGGTGATVASTALSNLGAAASATTISAGTGLTGGGSLAANRTISVATAGITSTMLASGVAVANIGYTPVNKAGDTMTGSLTVTGNITGTGDITRTGNITGTGNLTGAVINDALGDVRDIPANAKSGSYSLVAADAGKYISITTGGVTVPAGIFSVGQVVGIYNNSSSSQTITQGTSATLRWAGTTSTGNRTLPSYGLCSVLCVGTNIFVVMGTGLS